MRPPGACAPEEFDCRRDSLPAVMTASLFIGADREDQVMEFQVAGDYWLAQFNSRLGLCWPIDVILECKGVPGSSTGQFRWYFEVHLINPIADTRVGGYFDYPDPTQPLVFRLDLSQVATDFCSAGTVAASMVLSG